MITVRAAIGDPSVSYEPRYYERSFEWNRDAAQLRAFADSGWSIATDWTNAGRLMVRLTDEAGSPVAAAGVSVELFQVVRAGDRRTVALQQAEPGLWTAAAEADGAGLHELRFTIIDDAGRTLRCVRTIELSAPGGA
jgi:nitrogen fixation protein FixH